MKTREKKPTKTEKIKKGTNNQLNRYMGANEHTPQ